MSGEAKELRFVDVKVDTSSSETLRSTLWAMLTALWYPHAESHTQDTKEQTIEAKTVPENFEIVTIQGGITNKLYLCNLPGRKGVIVRVYGRKSELVIDRKSEKTVVNALSQNGFGCEIYGRFPGGILEEYLPGSCPNPQAMKAMPLQGMVARRLARMHGLQLPASISRSASLFSTLDTWLEVASTVNFEGDEKKSHLLAVIDLAGKAKQYAEYKARVLSTAENVPVVFAHNDLLSGNMLYDQKNRGLRFVDFEYGSYNYRGFDLANHFCECCGFDCEWENFPTEAEQKRYISAYLGEGATEDQIQALFDEVQMFLCASHLYWGFWGVVQAKVSVVDFDYLGYAKLRLVDGFNWHKDHCFSHLPSTS